MSNIGYFCFPIIFKEGDIVYNKNDKSIKLFIVRIDETRGIYICDGSSFKIVDEYDYEKVNSLSDLCIGEHVRIKKDPNCYSITEFLDDGNVKIHQIHGDDYYLTVSPKELCDRNYHSFNF